ncbi:MAG: EVE domain-containing protein, partial [Alsobacter sp.]
YPDHTAAPGLPWVMVDIKAVTPLKRPVTLAQVKAEPRLAKMALVTSMRLSVQPVTDAEWAVVLEMGGA